MWHKCCHLKAPTSSVCHHTMLQWHHVHFWQESLHMHLVTRVKVVTLHGMPKWMLWLPLHHEEGNGGSRHTLWHSLPGTLPCLALSQPGYILFKTCIEKYTQECKICTGIYLGMYKSKTLSLFTWLVWVWSIPVNVIDYLIDLNGFFPLVESRYSLNLKFNSLEEWVFTRSEVHFIGRASICSI